LLCAIIPKLATLKKVNKFRFIPIVIVTVLFFAILVFIPINPNPESDGQERSIAERVIFSEPEESGEVVVVLGGDVMLGRTVMTTSLDKDNPKYPFLKIGDTLYDADISFVNLEAPIVDKCQRHYEGLIFCADPRMVAGLVYGGIDFVSIENNHILNYGAEGLGQTKAFLSQRKIGYVDKGNLSVKETKGTKFGFTAFDKVTNTEDFTEEELKFIEDSASAVDVLLVSVHWGQEYIEQPSQKQRDLARQLVNAGADVIVGHHPHWVQTVENMDGVPVYYSLGNLVFDQMWSEKTKEGLLVRLTFENGKITSEEFLKTYMENWAQPELVDSSE